MKKTVTIVGAGLAGSEAALVLSRHGFKVKLYEMRPMVKTPVHKTNLPAELVCSNSFKSTNPASATGMLKEELKMLKSPLYSIALQTRVDAGQALAVNRTLFSNIVNKQIQNDNNIEYIVDEFYDLNSLKDEDILILATGPLTSKKLSQQLIEMGCGNQLSFYDAASPIIMADSINSDIVFCQDRYCDDKLGSYLNAPLNKTEYNYFIKELINAEIVLKKDFESKDLFQACQPIEEIAKSGFDAPRFGPMKPVGLIDPRTNKQPYAAIQLRPENKDKSSYNIVGFQTNLKFGEQKRVFRMIPGLESAQFARYGVMHRNTFLDAPRLLDKKFRLRNNIYVAGQLSGTEGYLEAIRGGHQIALFIMGFDILPRETIFGALMGYATDKDTVNYQPMHVNFGLIPPLKSCIKNKKERYRAYSDRGRESMLDYIRNSKKHL